MPIKSGLVDSLTVYLINEYDSRLNSFNVLAGFTFTVCEVFEVSREFVLRGRTMVRHGFESVSVFKLTECVNTCPCDCWYFKDLGLLTFNVSRGFAKLGRRETMSR